MIVRIETRSILMKFNYIETKYKMSLFFRHKIFNVPIFAEIQNGGT